jgi:glucose/arabinose dehydrogenase
MQRARRAIWAPSLSLISVVAASSCGSEFTNETPAPPAGPVPVTLQEIGNGLGFPIYLTSPPGDVRLFIVERGGTIRIRKPEGFVAEPFLDISQQVSTDGERGLLGLAFPPDYATSGSFVVHYTNLEGNTRVSLFRVSADPDRADPLSETVMLAEEQPFSNHNGGQITFGPDGFLYIGLGDGGSGGDPGNRAQRLDEPLGSILRIDVASPSPTGAAYSVPADNPFIQTPGARGDLELWPPQSLAVLLRSGQGGSLHRRRRREPLGGSELVARGGGRRTKRQLRVESDGGAPLLPE